MEILDLLKGKKIEVKTDVGVVVEMEIAKVKQNFHSQDLEPATRENDWWPASRHWNTYTVIFTNGATKEYDSLSSIKLKDPA